MCVQHHGGYLEYLGRVQYREKTLRVPCEDIMSTVGDILSTVGDILSTVGDVQYRGGTQKTIDDIP